jgi:hypothetical protein
VSGASSFLLRRCWLMCGVRSSGHAVVRWWPFPGVGGRRGFGGRVCGRSEVVVVGGGSQVAGCRRFGDVLVGGRIFDRVGLGCE